MSWPCCAPRRLDVLHDLSGFRAQAVQLDLQLVRFDAGRLGAQALEGLTVAGFPQGRFDAPDLVLDLLPLFRAGDGGPQQGHVVNAGGNPQRLQQGIDLDLLLPGCFQGLTVAGLLLLQPVMLGLVLAGGLQSPASVSVMSWGDMSADASGIS